MILAGLKTRGVSGGVKSNVRCFGFHEERGFREDGANMWVPPGSEREREEGGARLVWLLGRFCSGLAQLAAAFSFLLFFVLFLFLYNFCINSSNKVKSISILF
jgi:hypothetical protein